MRDVLEPVMEAGSIKRYHTMSLPQQTVGEHTYRVIAVLRLLTDDELSKELILAAHQHDVPEIYTGDIPFTFKRDNPEIAEMLRAAESAWLAEVGLHDYVSELSADDAELLHMADKLEMAFYGCECHEKGYKDGLLVTARILESLNGTEVTQTAGTILTAIEKHIQDAINNAGQ